MWLARVFDKARAKANQTQDGYIYPCPMDRAMMRRWGINASEFTTAAGACTADDQILAWLSERVAADQVQAANTWLLPQTFALDRQDTQEGVPGAIAPRLPWRDIGLGIVIATLSWFIAWFFILRASHP